MMFVVVMGFAIISLSLLSFKQIIFYKRIKLLKDISVSDKNFVWPKVTLIIPACNEDAKIESALKTLLHLDYSPLEIVVVDDRSTDNTGEILQRLCRQHQNLPSELKANPKSELKSELKSDLKIVTIQTLPPQWLGKVHAQAMGLKEATGDWILFTDADVHYTKDSLKKAIFYCEAHKIDFLTLVPDISAPGPLLKTAITQFLMSGALAIDIEKIKSTQHKEAIGCGAFNLVRSSAYIRSRGLEWLRMEVIDDGGFGYMLKESGAKCEVLSGLGAVQLEWYPSLRAFILGLEKNAFSLFQFNVFYVLLFCSLMLFTVGSVYVSIAGMFVSPWGWAYGLSLIIYYVSAALALRVVSGISPMYVLTLPMGLLLAVFVILRGMILFSIRGGMSWRGTFYARADLIALQRLRTIDFAILKKFPKV